MTSVSRLRISNILPSIKCSNCEQYVELSKMGEHICEITKGIEEERFKNYAYSSSFPNSSKSPLMSTNETMNEAVRMRSIHNKSSSEIGYDKKDNKESMQEKRHIFDRLNTITPGPLGLRNQSTNLKSPELDDSYNESPLSREEKLNKGGKKRTSRLHPYRWPNSISSQSSTSTFNTSPIKENGINSFHLKNDNDSMGLGYQEPFLSPKYENTEKTSTLKDKSNLSEYMNDKGSHFGDRLKINNSTNHSHQNLKKESKFPDENSERYLIEWARRDKELSSKFIEKTPNPVIAIQENNSKNIQSKMFNEKKTSNNKYGYFFERNSNSTAFSTSSNISRDEKISSCSISSPNSEFSMSNLEKQKNLNKNESNIESFDKTLNNIENSLRLFYTRSDDMLSSQTKNISQKNSIKNKYFSDFHCRRCNKYIEGKSIRCSDGKISGRFHRECFKCFNPNCQNLFTSSEVYVFEGEPFCAKHYHILNNSLCAACGEGIEGKCFQTETDDKYHFYCFTCHSCKKPLNGEYFDIDGKTYCEKDVNKFFKMFPHQHLEKRKTKILTMETF